MELGPSLYSSPEPRPRSKAFSTRETTSPVDWLAHLFLLLLCHLPLNPFPRCPCDHLAGKGSCDGKCRQLAACFRNVGNLSMMGTQVSRIGTQLSYTCSAVGVGVGNLVLFSPHEFAMGSMDA